MAETLEVEARKVKEVSAVDSVDLLFLGSGVYGSKPGRTRGSRFLCAADPRSRGKDHKGNSSPLILTEAVPAETIQIDSPVLIGRNAFLLKKGDLIGPDARRSFRVHHPLPGDGWFYQMCTQRRQRPADPPRRAGRTDQIRHLSVGGDLSGWNLANHVIDSLIQTVAQDRPLCPFTPIGVE